jgi:hypothetical protein
MRGLVAAALLALLAGSLVVVAPAVAANAAPARPAIVCGWTTSTHSNCDGLYYTQTNCGSGKTVSQAWLVLPDGTDIGIRLRLMYSSTCRTIWAYLTNAFPRSPPPSQDLGCHAEIRRITPELTYSEPVDPGIDFAYTKMVYDANVVSYAYAYCDGGAWSNDASTVPY